MLRIPSALLPAGHKVKKKKKKKEKIHLKDPPWSQPILKVNGRAAAYNICIQSFKLSASGQANAAPTENNPGL